MPAIGGTLSELEGVEHVITFVSCTLSKSECRYYITRRELVVFTQHFCPYLLRQLSQKDSYPMARKALGVPL